MVKRLITEEFIKYPKDKFGDKFKYECTEYNTQSVKGVFLIVKYNAKRNPVL